MGAHFGPEREESTARQIRELTGLPVIMVNMAVTEALAAMTAVLLVAGCGQTSPAGEKSAAVPPEPIAVNVVSCCISGTEIGMWVAYDQGLFQKHGITPKWSLLAPPTGVQALLAGDVQIGTAPGSAISAYAGGNKDLVFVAGNVSKPVFRIMAPKTLGAPENLRGKSLGVSGKYAPPAVAAMNYLEKQHGMKPDVDYKVVTFKQISDVLAALDKGLIDAGVLSNPLHLQAEKRGFQVLVDLSGTFDEANAYILTTRTFTQKNPEAVRRFLQAYAAGIGLARTNQEVAIASIQKHTNGMSAEDARLTYEEYIRLLDINMTADALRPYQIYTDAPSAKDVNPFDVMDFSFLKELDKSGFLKEHGFTLRIPDGGR